eukprot:14737383-Heterocapsa_arctica.AAC.1
MVGEALEGFALVGEEYVLRGQSWPDPCYAVCQEKGGGPLYREPRRCCRLEGARRSWSSKT